MKTCDTCKWWDLGGIPFGDNRGYQNGRACKHNKFLNSSDYHHNFEPDFVTDTSNNSKSVITGPKFGCILHEPKQFP